MRRASLPAMLDIMRHINTGSHRAFFRVLTSSDSAQAAMMVLKPGQATGEKQNEHPRAEQWLYVISGSGRARVGPRSVRLEEGSLLLVEQNEEHQVENTGRKKPLVTLNFYVPPAYQRDGEVRLRARGITGIVADAIRGQ
jgi:mannose-6-phosphate isomerase-like protein (cupin superfamily)